MVKTTIPTKANIQPERGSIVLSISDFTQNTDMHLLTIGNLGLSLDVTETVHTLHINKDKKSLTSIDFSEEDVLIIFSWSGSTVWGSVFKDDLIPDYLGSTSVVATPVVFGSVLSLFEGNYFNGTYERISTYAEPLSTNDLDVFSLEVFEETTEQLFEADFSVPTHYKKDVVIEDTFAPADGSPIILEDDQGPLFRQFFFDEKTSVYTKENTEHFTFKGEEYVRLAYDNLEPSYQVKIIFDTPSGEEFLYEGQDFFIHGQEVHFLLSNEAIDRLYGYNFSVTYQLERSYNIDFNEDVPHDGFRVNLVNLKADSDGEHYSSTENIRLTREGNRFEDEYLAKEIELNPLVNPQVQGFMYVDKTPQETQDFRISISSDYLIGNGIDTANVMIEAIDKEGNEVLSPYLSVYVMDENNDTSSHFGRLEPIIGYNSLKARNTSGRAYYEFTAPLLFEEKETTHRLFIVAYDRKSGIGAQVPLYIQSINEEDSYPVQNKQLKSVDVPFEYFARYFERELPEGHPLWVFDVNENNRLDRTDLEHFVKRAYDQKLMEGLTEELLRYEQD